MSSGNHRQHGAREGGRHDGLGVGSATRERCSPAIAAENNIHMNGVCVHSARFADNGCCRPANATSPELLTLRLHVAPHGGGDEIGRDGGAEATWGTRGGALRPIAGSIRW